MKQVILFVLIAVRMEFGGGSGHFHATHQARLGGDPQGTVRRECAVLGSSHRKGVTL